MHSPEGSLPDLCDFVVFGDIVAVREIKIFELIYELLLLTACVRAHLASCLELGGRKGWQTGPHKPNKLFKNKLLYIWYIHIFKTCTHITQKLIKLL